VSGFFGKSEIYYVFSETSVATLTDSIHHQYRALGLSVGGLNGKGADSWMAAD